MKSKTLWFIYGPATEAQKLEAKLRGLCIRDSQQHRPDDFLELCDAVCGDVPEGYKHLIAPTAVVEQVLTEQSEDLSVKRRNKQQKSAN